MSATHLLLASFLLRVILWGSVVLSLGFGIFVHDPCFGFC